MKYLPSPMNIVAVLFILFAIYSYLTNPKGGDGLQNMWLLPMLMLALVMLLIDYFLQKYVGSYTQVAIGEGVLLSAFFLMTYIGLKPEKIPEFVFPNGYEKDYVVVFFDIKHKPKLFGQQGVEKIPEDGIILVSTSSEKPRQAATFSGYSKYGQDITGFTSFSGQLLCDYKTYEYQVWYVGEYDLDKFDSLKEDINQALMKECAMLARGH